MALMRLPWQNGQPEPVPRHIPGTPIHQFTIVIPIAPGRRLDLAEACAHIDDDHGVCPFDQLPQVHMVRFEIFDTLPVGGRRPRQQRLDNGLLLFGAAFEGNTGHLARSMRDTMGPVCDAVFGCCDGYPGTGDPAFSAWLRAHEIRSNLPFAARTNSRRQIERALVRQSRLRAFMVEAPSLSPDDLKAQFITRFGDIS